jgi:hypothetical protein
MSMRVVVIALVLGIGILAFVAWNRSTERVPDASAPADPQGSMPGVELDEAAPSSPGVGWEAPKRWVAELAQGMRLAAYVVPGSGGTPDARCVVFYFGPGQGGSVEANMERWIGEFESGSKPARSAREIHGLPVSRVEMRGTYVAHGGPAMEEQGERKDWALLGAIVEGPNGPLFFKLTGPAKTVSAARAEFDHLLASLRPR